MKSRPDVFRACRDLVVLVALFWTPAAAWGAVAETGTCADLEFSRFRQNGALKWAGVARTIRQDAPVYADGEGERHSGRLTFNQQAEILDENKNRVRVRASRFKDKAKIVGWVTKTDLLCRNLPLKSETGLEMKFFIKTSTVVRDEQGPPPMVQIFQDPELGQCMGGKGNCREGASRFHMYFVFGRSDGAFLLADRYRLEEDDQLLGWVSTEHGFLWNNAFSLRPREDLKSPDGKGPGTICTYENLDDAVTKNTSTCQPVEGGAEWFKSPLRIPVLDLVDASNHHVTPNATTTRSGKRRFFKVALARPGLVGRRVGEGQVAISPGLAKQIMPGFKSPQPLESLAGKKRVDIFFLLDATASMEPVFDAVRGTPEKQGVIQEIIHTLKNTQGFRGTQFRFGFRVYRDPYAESIIPSGFGDGIGEGHPLPAACKMDEADQQLAFKAFEKAIATVHVSQKDENDDYQENLYGGLKQVLSSDIASCPDNLKLVFIIGDNGYKSRRGSREKYQNPVNRNELVQLMGGEGAGAQADSSIYFFIQTPPRVGQVKHPGAYKKAYEQFEAQSRYLLEKNLPPSVDPNQHFFRVGEGRMVSGIVQRVKKLGSSALIDEIILDIRGGAALSSIIDRLRRERVDIPGVYWHILKKGTCGELGVQCEQRVYDTTRVGYIEADDRVVEELWVSSGALSSWIRILRGFEGYFELPEAQLRRALINALVLGLQQEIRRPPIDVAGETPAEYAQRRGGLPVRRHSPLLSYNVNALSAQRVARNKDGRLVVLDRNRKPMRDRHSEIVLAAPVCELRRLSLWAIKSKEILEVVERDFSRPVFTAKRYSPSRCPDASPNGRELLRISGPVQRKPLGPDKSYRYAHTSGGRRGYWVPQEYLP